MDMLNADSEFVASPEQASILAWFSKDRSFFDDPVNAFVDAIDVDGHIIIRARAGTGKTTVLLEGVKRSPSKKILICAFSKDIQLTLEHRLGRTFPHVKAKTLHAVGLSCVTRYRTGIKIDFKTGERADGLALAVCGKSTPDAILRLVSKLHTKGREIAPHATKLGDLTALAITFECEPDRTWHAHGYDAVYVETKALEAMELASNVQNGATIDGSDMIFLPVRNGWLLREFDEVLVDEAQDMTTAQLEIALGVLMVGGRMAIVGDDRQGIFAFRGADSGSLDRLKTELRAAELGMKTTRRCGRRIVAEAQRLVPDFTAHETNGEGTVESLHISNLVTTALAGDWILSRVNAPIVGLAMQLLRSGKRTRILGRDIGQGLKTLIRKMNAKTVLEFTAKVEAWHTRERARLDAQLAEAKNGRKAAIESKIDGIRDQAEMLTSLAEGAESVYDITNRIDHLFTDDGKGDKGLITCSSVHRAKGQEADRVFILRDTLRSHNLEEQNIEYVAITRARETLVWVETVMPEPQPQMTEAYDEPIFDAAY